MGIFQMKPGDFGSIFARHKKEKMTSMENEDEKSLVDLPSKPTTKTTRKVARKNKYNAKFRRLREEWDESSAPPQYEPPQGFEFANEHCAPKKGADSKCDGGPLVPDAIDISVSATDTISTLEGSLVEILRKEHTKKKETLNLWQANKKQAEKQAEKKQPDETKANSNGWILNFADKSFGEPIEQPSSGTSKPSKVSKKERKVVEPKFYPLDDSPSSQGSSKFAMPTFDHPFSRQNETNIQFTNSVDYENDENVEKISSVGSDDFHQFVVKMPPIRNTKVSDAKPRSKRDESIKKAAESIAQSLSSSTPTKSRSRMVPMDGSVKRSRKVLADSNTTPTKSRKERREFASEPRRLRPDNSKLSSAASERGDPPRFKIGKTGSGSKPASVYSHSDESVMGQNSSEDSLLKDIAAAPTKKETKPKKTEMGHFNPRGVKTATTGEKKAKKIEMDALDPFNPRGEETKVDFDPLVNPDGKESTKREKKAKMKEKDDIDPFNLRGRETAKEEEMTKKSDHGDIFNPSGEAKKQKADPNDPFHQRGDGKKMSELKTVDPFDVETFSRHDRIWASRSDSSEPKSQSNDAQRSFESRENLIDLIRISSRRSEDETSKKPDPSPKSHEEREVEREFDPKPPSSFRTRTKKLRPSTEQKGGIDEDMKIIFPTKSDLSGRSAAASNPSGIPSNAILGSMLFRHAHSESTMALPGESGRPSDPFDAEEHNMPAHLEIDKIDQETVSSVTEDAGSFYHENFERWNNRAHQALNNLYSTYHSASANLNPYIRGARDAVKESTFFEA